MRFPRFPHDPGFPLILRAGRRARARLFERGGLCPEDVVGTLGASGGPKWLVLAAMDRVLMTHLLAAGRRPRVHVGSSIGAWRAAIFAHPQAAMLHERFLALYLSYRHERGDGPSRTLARTRAMLADLFPESAAAAILDGAGRLAIVTARARNRDLVGDGRWRLARGVLRLMLANARGRQRLARHVERVVFADPRLPQLRFSDVVSTQRVALTPANLQAAILASSAIPFVIPPVRDPPGGPPGAYWDGGIIDYHFAEPVGLPADMADGILLYPHFYTRLVPGWFDKPWTTRHRPGGILDDVLFLAPAPAFVRSLPMGRIPSRKDFRRLPDNDERIALWRRTVEACARLGEALEWLLEGDRLLTLLAAQVPPGSSGVSGRPG
ncbi:MAG: patatin-like phospholipase family protein [Alphaproteobacteria bacterium]|nr:MAG: patatin-like phospholipase family protein [Alphaproteobacteria bacterium]